MYSFTLNYYFKTVPISIVLSLRAGQILPEFLFLKKKKKTKNKTCPKSKLLTRRRMGRIKESGLSPLQSQSSPQATGKGATLQEAGGAPRARGGHRPCLGRLVSQSRRTALLRAPQHRAAAVRVCGIIRHGEPEIWDTAQMRSAET